MKLTLNRKYRHNNYCIDDLLINGVYFSNILEDTDRGLDSNMPIEKIEATKVYGKTAIPYGTYKVDLNTVSNKFKDRSWAKPFKGKIPRLLNVKGFDGVLIHPGNTPEDTLGCLLVGENKIKGRVIDSVETFNKLYSKLLKAKINNEDITIEIVKF